jgi:hypothetical protein
MYNPAHAFRAARDPQARVQSQRCAMLSRMWTKVSGDDSIRLDSPWTKRID